MNSNSRNWLTYIARIGYGAKAVVYIVLGILIILAALGYSSSEKLTKTGVFQEILQKPFGQALLITLIAGLACYSLWRIVQAYRNPDNLDNHKPKELLTRIFYVMSATLYAGIGVVASKTLMGISKNSDGGKSLTAEVLSEPGGMWLVGAFALCITFFSVVQLKHAWKVDFMDKFELRCMSKLSKTYCRRIGVIGFATRGALYLLVSIFFVRAAYEENSEHAGGSKEALQSLLQAPFGYWLLAIAGCGIIAFGLFCAFEARYRKTGFD